MNDLQINNPLDTSIEEQENIHRNELAQTSFVPSLSISHPISDCCKKQLCKPGEWFDGGAQASLGLEIDIVLIDYMWKFQATTQKQVFVESLKLPRNFKVNDSAYIEFFNRNTKNSVKQGVVQLYYLPKFNIFRSFFGSGRKANGCSMVRAKSEKNYGIILHLPKPIMVEIPGRMWYEFIAIESLSPEKKMPMILDVSKIPDLSFFKALFFKKTQDDVEEISMESGQR